MIQIIYQQDISQLVQKQCNGEKQEKELQLRLTAKQLRKKKITSVIKHQHIMVIHNGTGKPNNMTTKIDSQIIKQTQQHTMVIHNSNPNNMPTKIDNQIK